MKEDKAESLLLMSAKDGAGKTFLTANLGAALAKRNEKAAIIDFSGTGDVSMFMGLYGEPDIISLKELYELDEHEFKRYQNFFFEEKLTVLSIYPPNNEEEIDYLKDIILRLKKERKYIIIDGELWSFIDKICKRVLVLALPNPINLRLTKALIEKLKLYKSSNDLYVVLNKTEKRHETDIGGIEKYIDLPVLASVALDIRAINGATEGQKPFIFSNPRSSTARDISLLCQLLTSQIDKRGPEKRRSFFNLEALKLPFNSKPVEELSELKETVEPISSSEIKLKVHRQLINDLDIEELDLETLLGKGVKVRRLQQSVERKVMELLRTEIGEKKLTSNEGRMLFEEIIDEVMGLGPLESLLRDPGISEIMVNEAKQIFVERNGRLEMTEKEFYDDGQVMRIIERIVSPIGRRIDESNPMVDARLPDGSRVNAIIPPLALKGPTITIRKFSNEPFTVDDLIRFGTLNHKIAKFLRISVTARRNIIISGGTGSGKTTLLNVLSSFIPHNERIITIEDAAELQLRQDHVVSLEARPANIEGRGAITIRDLVRNALRMRPDRIIVGEVRGGEALDMLQAMNTGHDGSITTCHANSAIDSLSRLETMVLMAGIEFPVRAIRQQVASALDLIVQISRLKDGSRKIVQICEVLGLEGGTIKLNTLFNYKILGLNKSGKIVGEFEELGDEPAFISELKDIGMIEFYEKGEVENEVF